MRWLRPHLLPLILALGSPVASADLAVIVGADSPVHAMSRREVSDLYLGRTRIVDLGSQALPVSLVDLPAEHPTREAFFAAVNGMTIRRVNAYWARLRFSGEVLPPTVAADDNAVIAAVKRDPSAIGYVDATQVDKSVRIVLHLRP